MRKQFLLVSAVAFLGVIMVFNGCATAVKRAKWPVVTVLERIPDEAKPEWAKNYKEFWIEDGSMYASAFLQESDSLEDILGAAGNTAITQLTNSAKEMMRADFEKALAAQSFEPKLGEKVGSVFSNLLAGLRVSGVAVKSDYSEKVKEKLGKDEKIYYRSYVLAELSALNYDKSLQQLLTDVKAQLKAIKGAKNLLESMKKTLKKQSKK